MPAIRIKKQLYLGCIEEKVQHGMIPACYTARSRYNKLLNTHSITRDSR
jgi:hypothetical protein